MALKHQEGDEPQSILPSLQSERDVMTSESAAQSALAGEEHLVSDSGSVVKLDVEPSAVTTAAV